MKNETDFKRNLMYVKSNSVLELLEMALYATAIAGLLYFGYFQLAPWIWSKNLPVNLAALNLWIRPWMADRDGIELYALYILMFANLSLACALSYGWNSLAKRSARYFLVLPLVVACVFIGSIGFHPPMNTLADRTVSDIVEQSIMLLIVISPIIALLYYLQSRSTRWLLAVVAFLLIPVCFISTAPISMPDYAYILAPALRLFNGAGISEVYFQYDRLFSLIALAWMKLQYDINSFQIVAQSSFYLLLLGLLAFSSKWFLDKRLPIFLLISLVLVRIYAGPEDSVHLLQVTPLRLDMWLILLMLVYFKSPYHWSIGLFCGLMLLLHTNFGVIYSAAYIQLLLTLSVIETEMIPGKLLETAASALYNFIKKNLRNLAVILAAAMIQYLLFRNADVSGDLGYASLGIGFMKIATNSFYWYVPVILGLTFVLLLRLRARIPDNYLATSLCLIYLVIGNSLYFFGRSHENNIINISVILLLLFFLLMDVVNRFLALATDEPHNSFIRRNASIFVSLAFIASITIWYGDNITGKAADQTHEASVGQFIYPVEAFEGNLILYKQDFLHIIANVKSVTGDNPKVYFVSYYDFLFNYYGGYAPVGYYNPAFAWISKRNFNKFLQGLVDQGYYVVVENEGGLADDVLSSIHISNLKTIRGNTRGHEYKYVAAWK